MEHREAQELLELAAVEPDGFARLAAGDTTDAASLAGHVAGCPACAAEYERLRRLADELRSAVRAMPPADLRERTLAFVAATGRDRSAVADVVALGRGAEGRTGAGATGIAARSMRPSSRFWMLATAAAIVVAAVGVAGWWSVGSDLQGEQSATAELAQVTESAVRVGAQPDARTVELTAEPGADGSATGAIVLSAASQELVVIAEGLAAPAKGSEYRCWIEADGARQVIGKMSLYAGLATWAGWSDALAAASPGTRFGVSLVEIDGATPGPPLLTGQL